MPVTLVLPSDSYNGPLCNEADLCVNHDLYSNHFGGRQVCNHEPHTIRPRNSMCSIVLSETLGMTQICLLI